MNAIRPLEGTRQADCASRRIPSPEWSRPLTEMTPCESAIAIHTLGGFEILLGDGAPRLTRKSPARLLALLKAIIAFGASAVPEEKLVDAIWPDAEGDAAVTALRVALTRLRKLLRRADAVQMSDGKVSLNSDLCRIDALSFERIASALPRARNARLRGANLRAAERACALYRGSFLAADSAPWTVVPRERLRSKFVDLIEGLAQELERQGDWTRAAHLYLRGIEADALFERFYQGLIRCYLNAGRRAEALGAYRRLRQTLSVVLGIAPATETEALYRQVYAAA